MNIVSYIVVFVSIWWVVFYMVLPFGIEIPTDHEKGQADSAPTSPMLGVKILVTSFISSLITWGIIFLIEKDYFVVLFGQ